MMKLHLVLFLALCAIVVSHPVNEEKRMDELEGLLRELLLLDLEDESRLENSKRGFNSLPGVDDEFSDKMCAMYISSKYSYIAVRLSSTNQWEVVGSGGQGAGSEPTPESTTASFDEIKDKYILPDQPVVVFVNLNTRTSAQLSPIAAIIWVPEPRNAAMMKNSMKYDDLGISVLRNNVNAACNVPPFSLIHWSKGSDINYSQVFE